MFLQPQRQKRNYSLATKEGARRKEGKRKDICSAVHWRPFWKARKYSPLVHILLVWALLCNLSLPSTAQSLEPSLTSFASLMIFPITAVLPFHYQITSYLYVLLMPLIFLTLQSTSRTICNKSIAGWRASSQSFLMHSEEHLRITLRAPQILAVLWVHLCSDVCIYG